MSVYLDYNAASPMHAPVIGASGFSAREPGGPRGTGAPLGRLEIERRNHHLGRLRGLYESRSSRIPGSIDSGRQAARQHRE